MQWNTPEVEMLKRRIAELEEELSSLRGTSLVCPSCDGHGYRVRSGICYDCKACKGCGAYYHEEEE